MTVILLPLGSHEQHGPHLPWDTDTRIALRIAEAAAPLAAAECAVEVYVAPALAFGASWEHDGFPGLLSLNATLLTEVLVELARSADWASDGIVIVNGHGGNVAGVREALARVRAESRRISSWWPRIEGGDAHAGRTETSIMLAVAPELVRLDLAESGYIGPLNQRPVRDLSPNGVLGDPIGASASEGRAILDDLSKSLAAAILTHLDASA